MVVRACAATSGPCLREQLLTMVGEQPAHGYELCDRLGCVANGSAAAADVAPVSAPSGTVAVYRALRALERDGLVASRWVEPVSGPARRVYSLAAR